MVETDGRRPAHPPPASHARLQRAQVADALPTLEQGDVRLHFLRVLVTAFLGGFARLKHNFVKFQ
jgi:hypothetical protein